MVFPALCTQGFGIHFEKYFTTEIAQLVGFSYVDNCDMIQSDDDIESTHSQIKLAISEWEYIIIIKVRRLTPDKSKWYLVDYERIQRKWKCTNPGQDKILEDNNKTREIVPFRYLKDNKTIFMFGMYLAPDGNNKDQVKYMHKKATEWKKL